MYLSSVEDIDEGSVSSLTTYPDADGISELEENLQTKYEAETLIREAQLSERQKIILEKHYMREVPLPLTQIAAEDVNKVTQQRVRQLERAAFIKMRFTKMWQQIEESGRQGGKREYLEE